MVKSVKKEIIRINGNLHKVTSIHDEKGKLIHRMMHPLMVEFHVKDLLQVIIGASILAIPVGFTEETWSLGGALPLANVIGLLALSLSFIALFVYYNYYREHFSEHWDEFIKRVVLTYAVALLVVALILTLIQRAPWQTDMLLAFKRIVIVAFPASMSAAIADMLK